MVITGGSVGSGVGAGTYGVGDGGVVGGASVGDGGGILQRW